MSVADKPLAVARAPGKLILLGEHAVVYGRPALAVPVWAVEATVTVWPSSGRLTIESAAASPSLLVDVEVAPDDNAMAAAVRHALDLAFGPGRPHPGWRMSLASTVPIGSGMGSSAAVAVALGRAVGEAAGAPFDDSVVSEIALAAERQTHGTPSGIDNTVVALGRPILFRAGAFRPITVGAPLDLVIADTGAVGATRRMVADLRRRREARPEAHDGWFDAIAGLVESAVSALAAGDKVHLGELMHENHRVLQRLGVSTPRLDDLVVAAEAAGALGAKLSGAGGGGVATALVPPGRAEAVARAMTVAGATRVLNTTVPAYESAP